MSRVWVNQMFGAIADLGRQYFRRPGGSDPVETAEPAPLPLAGLRVVDFGHGGVKFADLRSPIRPHIGA